MYDSSFYSPGRVLPLPFRCSGLTCEESTGMEWRRNSKQQKKGESCLLHKTGSRVDGVAKESEPPTRLDELGLQAT